jgi:hypothetical protein
MGNCRGVLVRGEAPPRNEEVYGRIDDPVPVVPTSSYVIYLCNLQFHFDFSMYHFDAPLFPASPPVIGQSVLTSFLYMLLS